MSSPIGSGYKPKPTGWFAVVRYLADTITASWPDAKLKITADVVTLSTVDSGYKLPLKTDVLSYSALSVGDNALAALGSGDSMSIPGGGLAFTVNADMTTVSVFDGGAKPNLAADMVSVSEFSATLLGPMQTLSFTTAGSATVDLPKTTAYVSAAVVGGGQGGGGGSLSQGGYGGVGGAWGAGVWNVASLLATAGLTVNDIQLFRCVRNVGTGGSAGGGGPSASPSPNGQAGGASSFQLRALKLDNTLVTLATATGAGGSGTGTAASTPNNAPGGAVRGGNSGLNYALSIVGGSRTFTGGGSCAAVGGTSNGNTGLAPGGGGGGGGGTILAQGNGGAGAAGAVHVLYRESM